MHKDSALIKAISLFYSVYIYIVLVVFVIVECVMCFILSFFISSVHVCVSLTTMKSFVLYLYNKSHALYFYH